MTLAKDLSMVALYILFLYGMGALAAWLPPPGYYHYSRAQITLIIGTALLLTTVVGTEVLKWFYRVPHGMSLRDGMFLKWTEDEMKRHGDNPAARLVLESYSEKLKNKR